MFLELSQAAIATQGRTEHHVDEANKEILEQKLVKVHRKNVLREIEEARKEQKEIVEQAMNEYAVCFYLFFYLKLKWEHIIDSTSSVQRFYQYC